MFIEFHRNLLGDNVRNQAFYEALKQAIKPGMVVADVGTGTGLLAFMARRLGAREVYLIDDGPVLDLAAELARANHIDGLVFLREHSTAIIDMPPVDIVISETLGNYAYEEHLIENLNDARRFLKPDGLMMPGRVKQFAAPVISADFFEQLSVWDQVGYDLDFSRARHLSLNNLYVRRFKPSDLWNGENAIQCWDDVELQTAEPPSSVREKTLQWHFPEQCTIYGFAIWWQAELTPGIKLDTAPDRSHTHWEQIYMPLLAPLSIPVGGQVELYLHSDSRYEIGSYIQWQTQLISKDGVKLRCDQQDIGQGAMD